MQFTVVLALCLLGFAAFTNSLGLILMKKSIIKNENQSESAYIRNTTYIGGLACLIFGAVVLVGKYTSE